MGDLRREYGFWGTVASFRIGELLGPETLLGLVIGGGGSGLLVWRGTESGRLAVAGDTLAIAGALLGIVFGAFALVIAFLSDSYLSQLESTSAKTVGFLRPFMFATGLQVGVILIAVIYRGGAALVPHWLEAGGFVLLGALFVTALLDVVALARSVMLHGVARGQGAAHENKIRSLSERRDTRR